MQQIRTLCAVYELGSYAAAARIFRLSTSAAWEQVQHVESQYGIRLFERKGRQVAPTQAGRRLCELLRPILAGLDSTHKMIREEVGVWPPQLTIAAGVRMLIEEISAALRVFKQRYPDIRLNIMQSDSRDAEHLVAQGKTDLAMMLEPGPDHLGEGITTETAYEIDYLLVTPPRHPLRAKRALRLHDIVKYPLVVSHEGAYSRHLIRETFHRHGLTQDVKIACETANSAFTAACVRAGLGIGIIAGQPDGPLCKGLAARSLARWLGPARIVFLWKRGAHVPPLLRDLADTIRESMHSQQA